MTGATQEEGWFEGADFLRPVRVYYEDTDAAGVVYHANYLKFLERGRSDFLRARGVRHAELARRDPPLHFVVAHMEIAFKAGARIEDLLMVRTQPVTQGRARMVLAQDIRRDDQLILTATVTVACMNAAGRPVRVPADVASRMRGEAPNEAQGK